MKITIYSKPMCGSCKTALNTITSWQDPSIELEYKELGKDYEISEYAGISQNGYRSFPMLVLDGAFVGSLETLCEKLNK